MMSDHGAFSKSKPRPGVTGARRPRRDAVLPVSIKSSSRRLLPDHPDRDHRQVRFTPVGGSDTTQRRDHNYLNQITRTIDGATQTPFAYDGAPESSNGNLIDDGVRLYAYDALNRLVQVKRKSDGAVIADYTYDALGRRIRRVVSNGGLSGTITDGTTDFLYHSGVAQCIEERDPTGGGGDDPTRQYVWGIYIDELIQQREF